MKRTQLLVVAVLAFGLQGVAQASPYPADAEAPFDMSSLGATAWGVGKRDVQAQASAPYPADAEASFDMSSLAGRAAPWGVGKRESQLHEPYGVGFRADD
jgi:hypothetical protein